MPRPTQGRARSAQGCAYGALTPFGPPLQTVPLPLRHRSRRPLLPRSGRNRHGLGSSRSARRYSGNHCCLLLLRVLRCFSSPGSPPHPCGCRAPSAAGFPIRTPADLRPFAPPRGFSQLVTSFLASGSPGIPRAPFSSSPAGRPAPAGRPPAAALLLSSFFLALPPRQRTLVTAGGRVLPSPRYALAPRAGRGPAPQKGGIPAAPSGTATLLRLSPSHRVYPRAPLAVTHFRSPRLPWLDGRCVQGPGTYSPRRG